MTAVYVLASLALGAVFATFVHRVAAELARTAVVCTHRTRLFDPARQEWVHRVDPAEQVRTVLAGPPRRPPHVERSIRR